jgi:hypothetical protein
MSPRTFARIAAVAAILGGLLFLFNVSSVTASGGDRVSCGNAFTEGTPLKTMYQGSLCSDKETPKKIVGGGLVLLGALGYAGTYVRPTRRPAAR